jgi:SulP family sulfate permease
VDRKSLRRDGVAGVVLGVQSVPDGLATGLLAGVNPLAGLYAYLVGTATGALATSSAYMAVQATGAMAIIVADIPRIDDADDPMRALVTLTMLTGAIMVAAGLFRLGALLRFVSNAVMVGFINAVGVNIVLGQLANFTGFAADGANRVTRAFNTFLDPAEIRWQSVVIGAATIGLILLLERTPVGSFGLVLAVIATSALAALPGWDDVATLEDLGVVPDGLPMPAAPLFTMIPALLVPAASLAFVGLVQGAGVSANFVNPDGSYPDASRDFVGQGAANLASGLFRGLPVGGSVSASALNKEAGAQSRWSLVIASVVMAITILVAGDAVGLMAMPALAGLLILIGYRTIKPDDVVSVWRVGPVQKAVVTVTFVLTMIIPLQYAVLVGVGLSVVLHLVRQSNQVTVRRRVPDGAHWVEVDPPVELPANEVVVLNPYGSLFFAAAPVFEAALPAVTDASSNSVVILRLRGRSDLGTTFMDVLYRYAVSLDAVGSRLVIVSASDRIVEQLAVTGISDVIGAQAIYPHDERVGATVARAHDDAMHWVDRAR